MPDGGLLRAQAQQGEQGHLPPRGLRGQVHGGLHEVYRGHLGRILVLCGSIIVMTVHLNKMIISTQVKVHIKEPNDMCDIKSGC